MIDRTDELVDRLDLMVAILQLAFNDDIANASEAIRSDRLNAAILEATAADFVPSGEVQRRIAAELGLTDRTIRARLSQLEARRLIRRRGEGRSTQYRAAGLV
jgi:DNA-binding transcriptional ArsR family regulator